MLPELRGRVLALLALIAFAIITRSQSSITYVVGAPKGVYEGFVYLWDLNRDGTGEFAIDVGGVITGDVPPSGGYDYWAIIGFNGGFLKGDEFEAIYVDAGFSIGPGSADVWTPSGHPVQIARWRWQLDEPPILRPLTFVYLPVKFKSATGVHYGWMQIRIGETFHDGMRVVDYAFETVPNKPILAGAKPNEVPIVAWSLPAVGQLQFSWNADEPRLYQIQARASLTEGFWINHSTAFARGAGTPSVTITISGETRFFRVVEQ